MKLKKPKLRAGDFSPQFSVKPLLKDMRLASAMTGCADLPVLDTLAAESAARAGFVDEDFSAVIKMLRDGCDAQALLESRVAAPQEPTAAHGMRGSKSPPPRS